MIFKSSKIFKIYILKHNIIFLQKLVQVLYQVLFQVPGTVPGTSLYDTVQHSLDLVPVGPIPRIIPGIIPNLDRGRRPTRGNGTLQVTVWIPSRIALAGILSNQ